MEESNSKQGLRQGVALTVLFHLAFAAWLVLKPFRHAIFVAGDDFFQISGGALATLFCLRGWRLAPVSEPQQEMQIRVRRMALLLGLSLLFYTLGQVFWAFYEVILAVIPPVPSWADPWYLISYPLLLWGILLLPTRPQPPAFRVRIFFDGLMFMTAAITFSWVFVLGPTLAQADQTTLCKIVGVGYPLGDLLITQCLFLLSTRAHGRFLRRVLSVLFLGLLTVIATDSVSAFQLLHGGYITGTLWDMGWSLGYMPVGLAISALRLRAVREPETTAQEMVAGPEITALPGALPLWREVLPYAFLPAVGILAIFTPRISGGSAFRPGVIAGEWTLVGLVLIRQVLSILENRTLNTRLAHSSREVWENSERIYQLNEDLLSAQGALQNNVQALTQANLQLESLATTDALTHLPNHRALVTALDTELERARRSGLPCALLFLDLDHFKAINDNLGHAAGDATLGEVAALIQNRLRATDVFGRWGGEEFLVILPETDIERAQAIAESLRHAVTRHSFSAANQGRLTCSIGAASFPEYGKSREEVVDAADRAMYAAKRLGRNQVRSANDPAVEALPENIARSREETALLSTVEALTALIQARDFQTGEHTDAVADLAFRLALSLELPPDEARMIRLAASLHDLGKAAIPDALLHKKSHLTPEEWRVMRTHPVIGADIVSRIPALRALVPAVRSHHERWDGNGYPDRLAGTAIPLSARIIAVADSYNAIIQHRPYCDAREPSWALQELQRCAGTQFDPAIVDALWQLAESSQSETLLLAAA